MTKIKIENIVKEKLTDFEYKSVNPDWNAFEKKLPKTKISYSKYYIAAASIALITLITIPFINKSSKETKHINITNNDNKNIKQNKNTNKQNSHIIKTEKEPTKQVVNKSNNTNTNKKEITKNNIKKDTANNYTNTNDNIAIKNPVVVEDIIVSDNYKPISNFTTSVTKGCTPLKVSFIADDKNEGIKYSWDFNDGTISSKNKEEHIFTKSGVYKVKLTTSNNNNEEKSSFETEIIVYDIPKADFSYSFYNNTYLFEGTDCEKQIWKFGDNSFSNEINPEHIYSRIGETVISFTSINEYGCKSEINKKINIEPIFQIANAFSPNNDGENDEFGPIFENPEKYKYYLYIYNAYGDLIFKSLLPNQNWNGIISNSNSTADKGMYLWKIIINDKYNNKISKKGKLTIK